MAAAMVLALSSFAASIETDRTWYLAGEAMRVSVTADNALIAYAELCDTYRLAAGVVIGLKGGAGEGVIELPSHLHSGYYMLSVYTRDGAHAAQQLVAVVNPLHKSVDDDIEWVEGETHPHPLPVEGGGHLLSSPLPKQGGAGGGSVGFGPETEGHIIQARVKNGMYRGSQICPSLSIVGKRIHYFEGKMVNDSIAVFYTYGIQGKLPLVLSAVSTTGVNLPIEMISPFATLLPKELPHLVFHYKRSEVEARSIDMQRHQMAIAPAKREAQLGVIADEMAEEVVPLDYDEAAFGTKPYLTYNLDEYRQFFTVREVLLEYVSCVSNRRVNGVPRLVVFSDETPNEGSWPTLVLIDGMPVNDIERLLNYDARRVHYINIYNGQYTFGNSVYNGILSFVTRSGRLTNYPTEPNVQYLVYEFPDT